MTTVPYTFGNESSPIPLSQLDANFAVNPTYANTAGNVVNAVQANITSVGTLTALSVSGNVNGGNLRTTGSVSATGNIAAGNISTGGVVSAFGTVTSGAFTTTGTASAAGTITGGNILTGGQVSAAGNITGGNVTTTGQISAQGTITSQGIVSAIGNVVTSAYFVGNFLGNITGNLSVGGSNTQVLFNSNGNVGAAGGLTYNSGSNTLSILGVVSAQGNIYGGNLSVAGTTQLVGIATAPTAPNATSNNQVATTAFVNNQINQYANNVAITGGNISITNITADTVNTTNWTIKEISNTLYFQFSGSNVAKLDSAGNFTTIGNVTGFGTI
jgi:hypothetical protein